MSQEWTTILGAHLIKDSRAVINANLETLRSSFEGTSDPSTPAPVKGQHAFVNGVWKTYSGVAWVTDASLHSHNDLYNTKSEITTYLSGKSDTGHTHAAYILHSLATAVDDFLVASGANVFVKKTLAEVKSILGLGSAAYTNSASYVTHALATATNDFLVASGAGTYVKKTLAETRTILNAKIDNVSATSLILGRKSAGAGAIEELTAADVNAIIGPGVPSGTKMWFYQNTAPTGWTIDTTPADGLLAVKGGSQAYNVNGGNQAGTWTQPDCTLSAANLPAHDHGSAGAHTHTLGISQSTADPPWSHPILSGPAVSSFTTSSNGAHTHTSVGSGTAHNHGTTYRPLAQVGIICTKN